MSHKHLPYGFGDDCYEKSPSRKQLDRIASKQREMQGEVMKLKPGEKYYFDRKDLIKMRNIQRNVKKMNKIVSVRTNENKCYLEMK